MSLNLSYRDINSANQQQIYTLERSINKGSFTVEGVGDYLPGNVLVTDINLCSTIYMNKSGCNILQQSVEELSNLGAAYFEHFFIPEESSAIFQRYLKMQQKQDADEIFSFMHRVRAINESSYKWYFASAKLLFNPQETIASKILLIVNEVNSIGSIAHKINKVLEETDWMKKNFIKFCSLTKREKQIINLLVNGKSNREVADTLLMTLLTVKTHRRNIANKLDARNFALLYKFATTYGLK